MNRSQPGHGPYFPMGNPNDNNFMHNRGYGHPVYPNGTSAMDTGVQSANEYQLQQELARCQLECQRLAKDLGVMKAKWDVHKCTPDPNTKDTDKRMEETLDKQRLKMVLISGNLWYNNKHKYGGISQAVVKEPLRRGMNLSVTPRRGLTDEEFGNMLISQGVFYAFEDRPNLLLKFAGGLDLPYNSSLTSARSNIGSKLKTHITSVFDGPVTPVAPNELYPDQLKMVDLYRSVPVANALIITYWGRSFFDGGNGNGAVHGRQWNMNARTITLPILASGFTLTRWSTTPSGDNNYNLKPVAPFNYNWERDTLRTLYEMVAAYRNKETAADMQDTLDWYTWRVLPHSDAAQELQETRPELAQAADDSLVKTPDLDFSMAELSMNIGADPGDGIEEDENEDLGSQIDSGTTRNQRHPQFFESPIRASPANPASNIDIDAEHEDDSSDDFLIPTVPMAEHGARPAYDGSQYAMNEDTSMQAGAAPNNIEHGHLGFQYPQPVDGHDDFYPQAVDEHQDFFQQPVDQSHASYQQFSGRNNNFMYQQNNVPYQQPTTHHNDLQYQQSIAGTIRHIDLRYVQSASDTQHDSPLYQQLGDAGTIHSGASQQASPQDSAAYEYTQRPSTSFNEAPGRGTTSRQPTSNVQSNEEDEDDSEVEHYNNEREYRLPPIPISAAESLCNVSDQEMPIQQKGVLAPFRDPPQSAHVAVKSEPPTPAPTRRRKPASSIVAVDSPARGTRLQKKAALNANNPQPAPEPPVAASKAKARKPAKSRSAQPPPPPPPAVPVSRMPPPPSEPHALQHRSTTPSHPRAPNVTAVEQPRDYICDENDRQPRVSGYPAPHAQGHARSMSGRFNGQHGQQDPRSMSRGAERQPSPGTDSRLNKGAPPPQQRQHEALGLGQLSVAVLNGHGRAASFEVPPGQPPSHSHARSASSSTIPPHRGLTQQQQQRMPSPLHIEQPSQRTSRPPSRSSSTEPDQRQRLGPGQPPSHSTNVDGMPPTMHARIADPGRPRSAAQATRPKPTPSWNAAAASNPSVRYMPRVPEDHNEDISVNTHGKQISQALAEGRRRGRAYAEQD